MDCSLPGFSVHGIFQARVLEWVALSLVKSVARLQELAEGGKVGQLQEERMPGRLNAYPAHSSYTAIGQKGADGDLLFFPSWCAAKLLQSCQTLCATIDCSPPGSSVYGILYARIPEWVARLSSRGTSPLNDQFSSVQFSPSVMSDSFRPHELQHARPPCPSPTPSAYSNSRPSSW